VPGRLCILGEHTDWAGEYRADNAAVPVGVTVVCVTMEGLYARCNYCGPCYLKFECSSGNPLSDSPSLNVQLDKYQLQLLAKSDNFFSYIAGTVLALMEVPVYDALLKQYGMHIDNYKTTLPMRKGLSSSAAVCVLVVRCFCELHRLEMPMSEVMELAYQGEMNTLSRCGRMDQCVAMGRDRIGLMEFNGPRSRLTLLNCPTNLYFVVADMKAGKDTVTILRCLNDCFPIPTGRTQHGMHIYARHNQDIAFKAAIAIETGDISSLAAAMNEAQTLFDSHVVQNCVTELAAPALRRALNNPTLRSLCLAAKGVGSQGDGSVQFLCESLDKQLQLVEVLRSAEWGFESFPLTISASSNTAVPSCPSVNRVQRAILFCKDTSTTYLDDPHSKVVSFLCELVACGLRNIAVVCVKPCHKCLHTRKLLTTSVSNDDCWVYHNENLSFLSNITAIHCTTAVSRTFLVRILNSTPLGLDTDTERCLTNTKPILIGSFMLGEMEGTHWEGNSSCDALYQYIHGDSESGTEIKMVTQSSATLMMSRWNLDTEREREMCVDRMMCFLTDSITS